MASAGEAMRNLVSGLVLVLAVAGCAGSDGDGTSSGDRGAPTTSAPTQDTTDSARCTPVAVASIQLTLEHAREVQGVAGADEAKYTARARELVAEAERLRCPVLAGLEQFLD